MLFRSMSINFNENFEVQCLNNPKIREKHLKELLKNVAISNEKYTVRIYDIIGNQKTY